MASHGIMTSPPSFSAAFGPQTLLIPCVLEYVCTTYSCSQHVTKELCYALPSCNKRDSQFDLCDRAFGFPASVGHTWMGCPGWGCTPQLGPPLPLLP